MARVVNASGEVKIDFSGDELRFTVAMHEEGVEMSFVLTREKLLDVLALHEESKS